MEPREVYPGQYFVLSCGVDDLPNVSYHWLKDGSEIPGENSPKLVFNPFWPEDEGYYSCRVVGQEGDMLTKLMHLKVGKWSLRRITSLFYRSLLYVASVSLFNSRIAYILILGQSAKVSFALCTVTKF